ncbi:hypothetical protein Tco_0552132 [Tanacetum coccineum]
MKRTGRDPGGNIMILPPRIIWLDFHNLDDAKDIWLAVKARFGGNEESKNLSRKLRKSIAQAGVFADFKISDRVVCTRDMIVGASTNSKWSTADLSDPQHRSLYEDFDQIGKLDLEELGTIKWQMAMLSVRNQ